MSSSSKIRKLRKAKMINRVKRRKRFEKKKQQYKKRKEMETWCFVGGLVRLREPRRPRRPNEWVLDHGVRAWPTIRAYKEFLMCKGREYVMFELTNEDQFAIIVDIQGPEASSYLVQLAIGEQICWVKRSDVRAPK